jgi:hypothetical protein
VVVVVVSAVIVVVVVGVVVVAGMRTFMNESDITEIFNYETSNALETCTHLEDKCKHANAIELQRAVAY